jgi:hypothetical protein
LYYTVSRLQGNFCNPSNDGLESEKNQKYLQTNLLSATCLDVCWKFYIIFPSIPKLESVNNMAKVGKMHIKAALFEYLRFQNIEIQQSNLSLFFSTISQKSAAAARMCKNIGNFVMCASSNCFSKYLSIHKEEKGEDNL